MVSSVVAFAWLLLAAWRVAAAEVEQNLSRALREDRERAVGLWRGGQGLLWLQHLRRAGGTSLCHLLMAALPLSRFVAGGEACQPPDFQLRDAAAIVGHNLSLLGADLLVQGGNSFAQEYGPVPGPLLLGVGGRLGRWGLRRWVFVTTIRDPWARFWSQLRYEMAPCLGDPRHLAACIGGNFGQIGDWWSPTAHPDSVLGVPEARLGPSPALYTDNYYARVLLNRTDVAGPPLTDADFDAAARLLEERFSAVVVVEDFARSALQLVCAVGLDPGLARPLLRTRVRPYAAHEAMMIVPESDAHLGKRNADALRARFYRRNQLDYALYSRARATSSRRLAACARSRPEVERLWRAPLEEMSSAPPEPTPPPQPGGVSIDDLFGCSGGRIEQQPDGVYLLACPRSAAAKASSWWSGQVGNEAPPRKLGQPVPGAECWREGFSWQTCCAGRFGSQGNLECWDQEYTHSRCCRAA